MKPETSATPLINSEFLLQKFPGKGGWTYAEIPGLLQDKTKAFGWLKVKGTIDDYEFENFNLAPMKNGRLFMAVKAEIRKRIGKQAGDYVKIVLYEDHSVFAIPQELIDCLKFEESAFEKFMQLKERHQKEFVTWIYAAKREETIANRINQTIEMVLRDQTLYMPPEL